jgi:protein-tyrosine phosphatase
MSPFTWIDAAGRFRLAIHHRPRSGSWLAIDLAAYKKHGVDVLVSMQPVPEAERMGLLEEGAVATDLGIEFLRFAVLDHDVPEDREAAVVFADLLRARLEANKGVLIHCYAGIGRSGLMAVLTMMRAGFGFEDASERVSLARGILVPETIEQRRWLTEG